MARKTKKAAAKTRKTGGKPKRVSLTDHLLGQLLAELKGIQQELKHLNDQVAFEPGKLIPPAETKGGGDTGMETHSGD